MGGSDLPAELVEKIADLPAELVEKIADLPAELVEKIADRTMEHADGITEHADLARFRSVCRSWRLESAAHAARRRVPLLLLPPEDYSSDRRKLWSLTDDRIVETPMPAVSLRSFLFASTHGWMLSVAHDFSAAPALVHPFTGASAILPALPSSFQDKYDDILRDMVWEWSPHAVTVSPGKGALFCRPGDQAWSPVECSQLADISSITYCDGKFYLFDGGTRETTVVDAATFAEVAVTKPPAVEMPNPWCSSESTLVVSSDELLLIVRTRLLHPGGFNGKGELFKAFRAERRSRAPIWSEVADIGDRAVFVDHYRGFCVEANGLNGVKRNRMYVASSYMQVNTDDRCMDVSDKYNVSVLDFADHSPKDLWQGNLSKHWCGSLWQWPSWSMPNLH